MNTQQHFQNSTSPSITGNNVLSDVYPFSEIENHIIGSYSISACFSFTMRSDKAPFEGDKIKIADKIYEVDSVIDDTDDDEYKQGLSYSKVWLRLYVC